MRLLFGAIALIGACLLVAGCGEGPEPSAVAKSYVASNAASKCDLLAPALVEQLTGARGAAAVAACKRNVVRFPAPRDVRISRAKGGEADEDRGEEEGGEAEVELIADGREAEVKLAKQDGKWRIVALGE